MSSLGRTNRGRLLATCVAALALSAGAIDVRGQSPAWLDQYREPAARLIGEATGDTFAWQRLAFLTDTMSIGNIRSLGSTDRPLWATRPPRHSADERRPDGHSDR